MLVLVRLLLLLLVLLLPLLLLLLLVVLLVVMVVITPVCVCVGGVGGLRGTTSARLLAAGLGLGMQVVCWTNCCIAAVVSKAAVLCCAATPRLAPGCSLCSACTTWP
jgi:hypothetical protein